MFDEIVLTQESYDKLKKELDYLSTTVRSEIAKNLKEAAEHGDLRENAEFEAEKDRQAVVEAKINSIKNTLNNCRVINDDNDTEKVVIGKTVILYDEEFDEEVEYKIVDSVQANPFEGSISYNSPVGKALLNKHCGDIVEVELSNNKIFYKILKVI
ncbi:MAG: transcription elongation factor GreA [Clostridium sp.]|nr:transcription elongation factor GreA [Clostridium sp.]